MLLLFISLSCCSKKHDKVTPFYAIPLQIGNELQVAFFIDQNVYAIHSIIDTVFRTDGEKVYQGLFKYYDGYSEFDYLYYKDGYLIGTLLDTLYDSESPSGIAIPDNPFFECKLAKIDPMDGDRWDHLSGLKADDYGATYMLAKRMDHFDTFFCRMNDVFRYDLYDMLQDPYIMSVYYANQMGYIGTSAFDSYYNDTLTMAITYTRINGKEYGKKLDNTLSRPSYRTPEQNERYKKILHRALLYSLTGNIQSPKK